MCVYVDVFNEAVQKIFDEKKISQKIYLFFLDKYNRKQKLTLMYPRDEKLVIVILPKGLSKDQIVSQCSLILFLSKINRDLATNPSCIFLIPQVANDDDDDDDGGCCCCFSQCRHFLFSFFQASALSHSFQSTTHFSLILPYLVFPYNNMFGEIGTELDFSLFLFFSFLLSQFAFARGLGCLILCWRHHIQPSSPRLILLL